MKSFAIGYVYGYLQFTRAAIFIIRFTKYIRLFSIVGFLFQNITYYLQSITAVSQTKIQL